MKRVIGMFATAPDIPYESVPNFLTLPPNLYFGEGIGVARNSKGQIYARPPDCSPRGAG